MDTSAPGERRVISTGWGGRPDMGSEHMDSHGQPSQEANTDINTKSKSITRTLHHRPGVINAK